MTSHDRKTILAFIQNQICENTLRQQLKQVPRKP